MASAHSNNEEDDVDELLVCSYKEGYMKRQNLFSCGQCLAATGQPAVICSACAQQCHDGHEPMEDLYTKRNFRCDCGNSRFGDLKCHLLPDKDPINIRNNYDDHNLLGLYCSCNCKYDPSKDTMWQCSLCEDWFHSEHQEIDDDDDDDDDDDGDELINAERICSGCCLRYSNFLALYFEERMSTTSITRHPDPPKLECLKQLRSGKAQSFAPEWRSRLCKCTDCLDVINSEGLTFLLDNEDLSEKDLVESLTDIDLVISDPDKLANTLLLNIVESLMADYERDDDTSFDQTAVREASVRINEFSQELSEFIRGLQLRMQDDPDVDLGAEVRTFVEKLSKRNKEIDDDDDDKNGDQR